MLIFNLLKQYFSHKKKHLTRFWKKTDSLASDILVLKNENSELRKEIEFLRQIIIVPINTNSYLLPMPINIIREIKERNSKSRNIIIFNAPECLISDIDLIFKLLNALNLQFSPSSVTRLDKLINKPRPIRVEHESIDVVYTIHKTKKTTS